MLRLMKFTLIVFMVTHLNACLFFLLGESYKGDDGTQETWTTTETNMLPNGLGEEVVITRLSIAEQYCVRYNNANISLCCYAWWVWS